MIKLKCKYIYGNYYNKITVQNTYNKLCRNINYVIPGTAHTTTINSLGVDYSYFYLPGGCNGTFLVYVGKVYIYFEKKQVPSSVLRDIRESRKFILYSLNSSYGQLLSGVIQRT